MNSPTSKRLIAGMLGMAAVVALAGCGQEAHAALADDPATPTPFIQAGSLDTVTGTHSAPWHVAPAPGGVSASTTPTLTWTELGGADGYQVNVSLDRAFSADGLVDSSSLQATSWRVSPALVPGTTYYWRVRALFGSTGSGPWSDYSPFSVAMPPTPTPAPTPTQAPAPIGVSGSSNNGGGFTLVPGSSGITTLSISIWDAINGEVRTVGDKSFEEVLRSLTPGRLYFFVATMNVTLNFREMGISRDPVTLTANAKALVQW